MRVAHVVCWRYGDGSGSGAVSVHYSEEGAKKMLDILNAQDGMRQYFIDKVPTDEPNVGAQSPASGAAHD